jgi:hypothetical protein
MDEDIFGVLMALFIVGTIVGAMYLNPDEFNNDEYSKINSYCQNLSYDGAVFFDAPVPYCFKYTDNMTEQKYKIPKDQLLLAGFED